MEEEQGGSETVTRRSKRTRVQTRASNEHPQPQRQSKAADAARRENSEEEEEREESSDDFEESRPRAKRNRAADAATRKPNQRLFEGTDSGVDTDTYFGLCTYPGRELRHRIDLKMDRGPLDFHPGPLDPSLLSRQGEHRSNLIWAGEEPSLSRGLQYRTHVGRFWTAYGQADLRVRDAIDRAGFAGVCRIGNVTVDHSLITAMVERWRPETHTFHLPVGEATVTLQDVAVLTGLRVDGEPIIGGKSTDSVIRWEEMCLSRLGFRPQAGDIEGNRLMARAIEAHLHTPLPELATDDDVDRRARCLLMLLFGGLLFSDKSNKFVPLRFLIQLDDLCRCGQLAWGSGVLSYFYRCLCDAAKGSAKEICGPMVLLQLWVYEHLPILRPVRAHTLDMLPDLAPYGARWNRPYDLRRLPTHVLVTYRDQLDALTTEQFLWMPYRDILHEIPVMYLDGSDIWRSSPVPLICWDIVEYCFPDRVMRQFGDDQGIPPFHDHFGSHYIRGRGKETVWTDENSQYVQEWTDRRLRIVVGMPSDQVIVARPEYMNWYSPRTRLLIGNPSLRPQAPEGYQSTGTQLHSLASMVRDCMDIVDQALPHANPHSRSALLLLCDKMRRAIGCVGSLGTGRRQDVQVAAPIAPTSRRPRAKIDARGEPGVRRGGRRPRARGPVEPGDQEPRPDIDEPGDQEPRPDIDDVQDHEPDDIALPLLITYSFPEDVAGPSTKADDGAGPSKDPSAAEPSTQADDGVITQVPLKADFAAPGRRRPRSDSDGHVDDDDDEDDLNGR